MITLTPELTVPLPIGRVGMLLLHEKAEALFRTAEFLTAFGAPVEPTDEDQVAARVAFHESVDTSQAHPLPIAKTDAIRTSAAARHLKAVLSEYDEIVVRSAVQIRTYVTNKLIEETTHPDARIRMRALELLGKVGDVGLFVERSEITVRHKTTVELEDSIKSRIAKLLEIRSKAEDIVDVDSREPNPKAAAAELLREDDETEEDENG